MRKNILEVSKVFLLVDDDAVLEALSFSVLQGGFRVETYTSGLSFLNAYIGDSPACLLMDWCLFDMNALAVRRELIKRNISIPMIIMTGNGTSKDLAAVLEHEAIDFLDKPFSNSELLDHISEAMSQDFSMRSAARTQMGTFAFLDEDASLCYQHFSTREWKIMNLVMCGKSARQIAGTLELDQMTVDTHLAELMRKMHASSMEELQAVLMLCIDFVQNKSQSENPQRMAWRIQPQAHDAVYKI